jgi:hypothetical protein
MRSFSFFALALFSVTLASISCGSSDEKQVERDAEAGAGGEAGGQDVSTGGSEAPVGGAPTEVMAGAPASGGNGVSGEASGGGNGVSGEASSGGNGVSGEAGSGGAPSAAPLSLEALAGDWTATSLGTYACESNIQTFELKIEGSNVTIPGWPYGLDGSGSITEREDGSFTLELEYEPADEISEGGTILGQFFVEPTAQYALLVTQSLDTTNDVKNGYFAILQRTTAPALEITEADFLGDWAGSNVRLGQDFAATAVLESSATIAAEADLIELDGTDADGVFSGEAEGEYAFSLPSVGLEPVVQGNASYASAFLLSPDKRALAGVLLTSADGSSTYGLCDQQIFAELAPHKFALWTKAE